MARLFTVTMTFCLFAASLAEIDLGRLPGLIQKLKTDITKNGEYPMYAVAMSVPARDSYDETITDTLTNEKSQNIKNSVLFKQNRLVIATKKDIFDRNGRKLYTEHAEYRVLQNLDHFEAEKGDFLVFYSLASPCDENCANPKSKFKITDKLCDVFNNKMWGEKAFVFEYLFKPQGQNIDPNKIKLALEHVGKSIGVQNIFRCYTLNRAFRCISCAAGKNVSKNCYTE